MAVIIITCVAVLVSLTGAAIAQDAQVANTLLGVGGGAGGVGGITGITSLIQSNRAAKASDELFSKVNRLTEAHAGLGDIRGDLTRISEKMDHIQADIHAVAMGVVGAGGRVPRHRPDNPHHHEDWL